MRLNSAQKSAVEYLDGPLLVLAGPGTGKTQLLSAKVAHILEHTDTTPDSILCLTFTEAGATNMRTRLSSIIGSRAATELHIGTYHNFGTKILKKYREYSPNFSRPLESNVDEVTMYQIVSSIQKSLPLSDILHKENTKNITSAISEAKNARLTADDLLKVAEQNLKDTAEVNRRSQPIFKNLKRGMKYDLAIDTVYQPLADLIAQFVSDQPIVKNVERELNTALRELDAAFTKATEESSVSPLTKWRNHHFELDGDGSYRLKNLIANKKLLSLCNIMRAYNAHLEEHGLYDYSDMIGLAIEVLSTDEGFRLTMSEQFQHILLDEFQDTNPSQFELIRLLTDYEQPLIMAVGDDDQAIYEFQGASASNLIDFRNHYNAHVITLTENYRSPQEILDFSRSLATQISSSFAHHFAVEKTLTSNTPGTHCIARHHFTSSDAEYSWIADDIKRKIANGISPNEIAIIFAKHRHISPAIPYLKAVGLNLAYEKRENILEDPAIRELCILADFIRDLAAEGRPSHKILEILSFPFWELDSLSVVNAVSEIGRAKDDKKSALAYLAESDDESLSAVAHFLSDLVLAYHNTPMELMVNYLIGVTPLNGYTSNFQAHYAQTPEDAFALYEKLGSLRSAITLHTNGEQLLLGHLADLYIDYTAAEIGLINTSPYQDGDDSINLLTAHKAKGLEFDHVYLLNTDNYSWGNSKGNNNFFSLPKNLAPIRHSGATADEQLRLLFVAITRAKTQLTLTSASPLQPLTYLNEYEKDGQLVSPLINSPAITHPDELAADQKLANLKHSWYSQFKTPDIKTTLKARMEHYKLSASALTTFIDIVYAGPPEFFKRYVMHAPSEPPNESLTYGNLIHSVFEQVANHHLSDAEALEFYTSEVEKLPLLRTDLDQLLAHGQKNLPLALQTFGALLRAQTAVAELPIPSVSLDGAILTGKIDHLQINPQEKTIEVYDFKTSGYKPEQWDKHSGLYKYSLQLGFYKLLLNLSPKYRDYKVTKGHILFLEPEQKTGRLHDKVYEFNAKDEEQLKSLIAAVYHQAKTLNFLDHPELCLEPDKNRKLKDIKDFISLVLSSSENPSSTT